MPSSTKMRAVVQDRYGPPEEVLRVAEVERPVAREGEVLIRAEASCVHADIWHEVTGRPYVLRGMGIGSRRPANQIPGTDVAGVVEEVGVGVTAFEPGDAVFGETLRELVWKNGGAFAEYVVAPQETLARKPDNVSFAEAGSIPAASFIVSINLRGTASLEAGKSVLVNGAAGNVGSLVVQLAKARGAEVTGVDRGDKLDLVRSLGADRVVDYTRADPTRSEGRYDLIVDVASTLSLGAAKRVLTSRGVYLAIGHDHFGRKGRALLGSIPRMLGLLALSKFDKHLPRAEGDPMPTKQESIEAVAAHLAAGRITPIVDRQYPLEEVVEAMSYLASGAARGRIVLTPTSIRSVASNAG